MQEVSLVRMRCWLEIYDLDQKCWLPSYKQ